LIAPNRGPSNYSPPGRTSAGFSSVENLKPARTLALDDNFAVQRAQFDLANVAASGISLSGNQGETRCRVTF